VVAVTREAAVRARLAQTLPAGSVLLLVPDYPTALDVLGSGVLNHAVAEPGRAVAVTMVGGLEVDRLRQQVSWNGSPLPLTRLERGIVACLAESPARVWPHESLYQAVWRDAWLGDAAVLHSTVKRLRRKLREAGVPAFLDSVRGVGFRLRVDVPSSALQGRRPPRRSRGPKLPPALASGAAGGAHSFCGDTAAALDRPA
jgi:two-component system, OmpR family, response regulator MtrA